MSFIAEDWEILVFFLCTLEDFWFLVTLAPPTMDVLVKGDVAQFTRRIPRERYIRPTSSTFKQTPYDACFFSLVSLVQWYGGISRINQQRHELF